MTQQPVWKCIGHIGDVDPIAHGGGFIYEDETGVYPPEVAWFEPGTDEQWHKTEGTTPLQVYRFILEKDSMGEWWYSRLTDVSSYTGLDVEDLQDEATGTTFVKARLYGDLISYFGAHEFDSYPVTMTEDEAYAKFADEMRIARAVQS